MLENIPKEMTSRKQWCVTMPSGTKTLATGVVVPQYKRPANATGAASATDISSWMSFEDASALSKANGNIPIGFMLSATDNLTCIDIDTGFAEEDIKNQPDPAYARIKYDFHQRLIRWLNRNKPTYTERSVSGYNHHVWLIGNIGTGMRLNTMTITLPLPADAPANAVPNTYVLQNAGIEIYSQERFIVTTGDSLGVSRVSAIDIDILLKQASAKVALQELAELPPIIEDGAVIGKLLANEYFMPLWTHKAVPFAWTSYEHELKHIYPSQSEADYALIIAIAKLTESNSQVRSIFRQSGLGQRHKATSWDGYINRSLSQARGVIALERQQLRSVESFIDNMLATKKPTDTKKPTANGFVEPPVQPAKPKPTIAEVPHVEELKALHASKPKVTSGRPKLVGTRKRCLIPPPDLDITDLIGDWDMLDIGTDDELDYPPGLAGIYGQWLYGYAPQPMVEACIVNTLAVLAGIGGNCYKINRQYPTGINGYFILMGLSATGKDILHSGMGHLRTALADCCPEVHEFIDHSKYKSEAALTQAVGIAKYDSMLHIMPEFAKELHGAENGNNNANDIFSFMLPAYSYSTIGNSIGATRKSGFSVGKVGAEVKARPDGFGYSMVGECTEGDLNKALSGTMLRDGRLSRFLCVRGDDYLTTSTPNMQAMPPQLKENFSKFVHRAMQGGYMFIDMTPDAERIVNKYYHVMVEKLNEMRILKEDPRRVIYTRARLKAWRIAGSLAALENPDTPVITPEQMFWAIGIVNRDIAILTEKIDNREVGDSADDHDRMDKLKEIIDGWVAERSFTQAEHKRLYNPLMRYGIMPHRALREQTRQLTMFKDPRTDKADIKLFNSAVNSLVNEGVLLELSEEYMLTNFSIRGKGFQWVLIKEAIDRLNPDNK